LKGKRLRADEWWDGDEAKNKDLREEGDWVKSEGENGFRLTMEVEKKAEITFM
jgi:hypothetical protein